VVVPLSTLPAVGLAEGHESCAVLCGDGNRMRTAEDDLLDSFESHKIHKHLHTARIYSLANRLTKER